MALVICKQVSFRYDGALVVTGIDFSLEAGDYLCIVGENGSGKSTLIKGLLGLLRPAAGSIEFGDGLTSAQIGYLPQQAAAQRNFPASVTEVVLSGRIGRRGFSPFYSRQDRQAAHLALERLGISELADQNFGDISGGQQQRVLLARAVCAAADGLRLLVLDEPMSALDPHVKGELYALIAQFNREQQMAIIMVTHDVQTATNQASHILLLDRHQEFFGTAHQFMHTTEGQELMRDSCAGHCVVCGLSLDSERGHNH
jgi:zinc transport system ATP-binding protein